MTTQKRYSNPENMLKGRMAETLVEELLKNSGNSVYRFGYEAIMQNLVQIKKDFDLSYTEAGRRIKSIPDFIVIDHKGDASFVEVKYRANGKIRSNDIQRLERIGDFWNAKIVFVNCMEKPYFRVSKKPYLNDDKSLCSRPLINESEWKISEKSYGDSEALVEKFLLPITLH